MGSHPYKLDQPSNQLQDPIGSRWHPLLAEEHVDPIAVAYDCRQSQSGTLVRVTPGGSDTWRNKGAAMTNLTGLWHFFSTRDDEWFHRLGISELFFVGMSVELPLLYHRNLWCSIGCHEPCGSVADIASTPPYLSTEMCSETKVRLSTALAFGSTKMRLQTKWMFLTVSTTHKVK